MGEPLRISFGPAFVQTDIFDVSRPRRESNWVLIELPKNEIEALQAGESFQICERSEGAGSKAAALSTKNGTYQLEFLENSNSLLVGTVSEMKVGLHQAPLKRCTVISQCCGHMVLKPATADSRKVQEVLSLHILGQASEPCPIEKLRSCVAASPTQLLEILAAGPYVEHAGGWWLLPRKIQREIVDTAIMVVTANGWNAEAIDTARLLAEVQQHLGESGEAWLPSVAVLKKVLKRIEAEESAEAPPVASTVVDKPTQTTLPDLAETLLDSMEPTLLEVGTSSAAPSGPVLRLDSAKMNQCRVLRLVENPEKAREEFHLPEPPAKRRRMVLSGSGIPLTVAEFTSIFKELTGAAEMQPDDVMKVLLGHARVDDQESTIHPLDWSSLPQEPTERLRRLFREQTHWESPQLESFMVPVLGTAAKAQQWLLKHTRAAYLDIDGQERRLLTKKFENF